ncbi:MAG: flippase-like domain-containing protein [Gammaproteobacteria bacterium]|nr:flippase-like domain-containing protein [Gammaproteobacteria bacterium]
MVGNSGFLRKLIRDYSMPLFVIISIAYASFYLSGQVEQINRHIRFAIWPLIFSAVFQCMFWLVSSYMWSMVVFSVAPVKPGIKESFLQLSLVNLGKYIPGKVWGMIARGSRLARQHGLDTEKIVQATYIEQVFLMGAGVVVMALLGAVLFDTAILWFTAMTITLLVVIAIGFQQPLNLLIRFARRLAGNTQSGRSENFVLSISRQFRFLVMYMLVWLLLGMVMYGISLSLLPAAPGYHDAAIVIIACIAGMSAGFLAVFAPGGVGVREAVSAWVLSVAMPLADAVLLVLVFRIWLAMLELLVGGGLVLFSRRHSG